jgi:hypothetical protein
MSNMLRTANRIARKRDAERRFPHKVDMRVPPDELVVRVRGMVAWCWQRAAPGAWEQHGEGGPSPDVVRFYFMDARVAEAFKGRWYKSNGR